MVTITPTGGPPPMSKTYRFTSDEERERRLSTLRKEMEAAELDALIVMGRDDIRYRGRAFYLSDVWQLVAETHVVVMPQGDPVFIGGQVFGLEQAELSDWVSDIRLNGNAGQELANVLRDYDVASRTVGIVGLTDSSFSAWHLNELQAGAPDMAIEDATDLFERSRQVSSPEDLAKFAETSNIMNSIYAELEGYICPRMREIDLAAEAHRVARAHGLRDPMILLQTTPYGAISFGTTKPIKSDDLLTVWIESAGPSGHWVEYRRCYSFGDPRAEAKEFWALQQSAVQAGLKELRPGAMASEFVLTAKAVLRDGGYEFGYTDLADSHFMYSLHGIGTDAIQGVWVPGGDRVLEENEVVNIHPTIEFESEHDLEKYAWLGVTDNAIVTTDGGRLMTHDEHMSDGFIAL